MLAEKAKQAPAALAQKNAKKAVAPTKAAEPVQGHVYDNRFDDSDVQISFIPRINFQEVKDEPQDTIVDAGDEVSSNFLARIVDGGNNAEKSLYMATAEGQVELSQAKKDQEELLDAQDVQIRFVDGGQEAFAKPFASEETNDKNYVKSAVEEGAAAENALYQQTSEFAFAQK
jgi:hypothetical protein